MDKLTAALPAPVCKVHNVSIVSTSAIVRKVDQCLSKLYPEDPKPKYPTPASATATATATASTSSTTASTTTTTTTTTSTTTTDFPAVSITSKSATASKAITVAEIVKRRIGERGGQWYQYTALSSVTNDLPGPQQQQQQPQKKKKKTGDEDNKKAGEEEEEEEEKNDKAAGGDEDDPYALLEEKTPPRKRKVPLLTIYISRSPIPELQKLHGLVSHLSSSCSFFLACSVR